jgi:hypothetical protein
VNWESWNGLSLRPKWLQDPELRRRSHVGLNKGEQQNALRRAVFFNRLREIRDRSYENQRHRASSLNLLVAAIILWNTTSYLQRAVDHLRIQGHHPASGNLAHLSPLGWEHDSMSDPHHRRNSGGFDNLFFGYQSNRRRLPLGHIADPRSR